jgi:predicted enzyme related to lactoylglutathione lyase
MSRPIHFEIHASDPQRAIAFYGALLGWTFSKYDGPQDYWLIKTGDSAAPGIDGGMLPRHGAAPEAMQAVNAFVCTIGIANLDTSVRRVGELGGSIALPKMAIPKVGWLAYVKDTEGNILGLMQADADAQ